MVRPVNLFSVNLQEGRRHPRGSIGDQHQDHIPGVWKKPLPLNGHLFRSVKGTLGRDGSMKQPRWPLLCPVLART